MAFKLKSPYEKQTTPIYMVDDENDVLGRANNNGTITINNRIDDPKQLEEVIDHEEVHVNQFKNGDLDYDDKNVYWKGKTYSRSQINEGNKKLPWEQPAYKASNNV